MAEIKTKVNKASVEKFLASVKDKQKREDCLQISKIMEKASGFKPEVWGETGVGPSRKDGGTTVPSRGRSKIQQNFMSGRSIIGFGRRKYKYANGKEGEWMVIGFAPRKGNIALYGLKIFKMTTNGLQEKRKENDFLLKLGKYKEGGGCLYINKLSDINTKELEKIVKLAVKRKK
jgi:hypothetical protein